MFPSMFGVILPHRWLYASADSIVSYARLVEELGFKHVWVTDHVGVPPSHLERGHIFYEALTTLSFVGGVVKGLDLGTCVLQASIRNPILTAKQLATLDRLSKGRVILGLGTGWIREEVESFGVRYDERIAYLKEFVKVLRLLWTKRGVLSYSGRFFRFENLIFEPKPLKKIPILIGGNRISSIRMASRIGDGWIPWAVPASLIETGRRLLGGKPIYLATPINLEPTERRYVGALGEEHLIIAGSERDVMNQLDNYLNAGVKEFVLSFRDIRLFKDPKMGKILEQTKRFAKEIMPSFLKA